MNKLIEKLVHSYAVLYYYHLIDESKGKTLKDVPENIRNEVEIRANERYVNEYKAKIGGE